jgi:hypothetical protein
VFHTGPRAWLAVEALENRTVPAFLAPVPYPGLTGNALVGDFNNDHIPDLVAAAAGSTSVSVLLGNGDGTFRAALVSPVSGSASPLTVGDFNRDGNLDIVTASSVLLGNGDGTFGRALPAPPGAFAAADVNNDGQLDLLASHKVVTGTARLTLNILGQHTTTFTIYTTYLDVYLGNSDGSFRETSSTVLVSGVLPVPTVVVGDFTGDGNLDFLSGGVNNVVLFPGDGSGGLHAPLTVASVSGTGFTGLGVQAGDFNGDGKLDFMTSSQSSQRVGLYLNSGGGSFAAPQTFAVGAPFSTQRVGDFNDDGKLDVVTLDRTSGVVSFLPGNGDGTLGPAQWSASQTNASLATVADLDGDGFDDLVLNSSTSPLVQLNVGDRVTVTIGDVTLTEGNSGTKDAAFTVNLSRASDQPVTVAYATADGTATAGSDYQAVAGTLTFSPGETSKTIIVPVYGDRVGEANETFVVNLSQPTGAGIIRGQGFGTILDDEPRITISDVTQAEGRRGQTAFTFTVTMSAAYDVPVTLDYATTDGTATAASNDYTATSGSLTFAPGETTRTITVWVNGDKTKENDETFFVNLSGAWSSLFVKSQGIGTILNDD